MKLVSKDTGGLHQLLVALAAALQDDYMLSQLEPAAQDPPHTIQNPPSQQSSPTVRRVRSKRSQPPPSSAASPGSQAGQASSHSARIAPASIGGPGAEQQSAQHEHGSSIVFRAVRSQQGAARLGRADPNVLAFGQSLVLRCAGNRASFLSAPSGPLRHHTPHDGTLDRSSALSASFMESSSLSIASTQSAQHTKVPALQDGDAVAALCSGSGTGTQLETWCLFPEHSGRTSVDWGLPVAVGDVVRLGHPALGGSLRPHPSMSGGVQIEADPTVSASSGSSTSEQRENADVQCLWRVLTPQGIARTLQGEAADGSTVAGGNPQLIAVGEPVMFSPLGQPHVFLSLEHGSLHLTLAPLPEFVQQELAAQPLPGLTPPAPPEGASGVGVDVATFNSQVCISSPAAFSTALLVPPPAVEGGEGGLDDAHAAAQVGSAVGLLTPAAGPAGMSVPARFMFLSARPHAAYVPAWAVGRTQGSAGEGALAPPPSVDAPPVPLSSLPAALQEAALVEDCLDVLLGFPGRYIGTSLHSERAASAGLLPLNLSLAECTGLAFGPGDSTRHGEPPMDASVLALVQRIVPVAEQLWECRGFAARRGSSASGAVSQALSSTVGQIIAEVSVAVTQLEGASRNTGGASSRGGLSLHALWFQLQPLARTVAALHAVCRACRTAVGGALLQKLYTCWLQAGDSARRELFLFLLSCSAVPFMETLGEWIFTGKLASASRQEGAFFVTENKALTPESLATAYNSRFWEDRVTLLESQVPGFLSPHAETILTTGKYLYALRLCGVPASYPNATKVPFSTDPAAYRGLFQNAHKFASESLMSQLMVTSDLRRNLNCMKRFFLMSTGDFLTSFLEAAGGELSKQVDPAAGMGLTHASGEQDLSMGGSESAKSASLQRLQALLDISLRSVGGVDDAQVDAFSCILVNSTLVDHIQAVYRMRGGASSNPPRHASSKGPLKAYEAFALQYHVQWPLTLVLSNSSITKYQLLFRHMFFCRYVERVLCDCWQSHQEVKGLNLRATLARSYLLRQRMLHFLQNFIYYVSWEVFEPRWHEMQEGLTQCRSVDDVARVHSEFLRTCMKEALLVNDELLKLLQRLVMLCFLFANQLTNTLHACKLSPEEVDARAGITPEQAVAMRRARAARAKRAEEGVAYGAGRHVSATGSSRSMAFGGAAGGVAGAGKAPRRTLVERFDDGIEASDPSILSDVQLRTKRAAVQVAAIEHQAGQGLWQQTMEKSGEMFDRFLRSFMQKLDARAERELGSRLRQLLTRLDYNGFYSMQQALQE